MSDTRILAADGTPLKKKLAQSMFRTKLRAFGLVCPLLALIISAFVLPILFMLSAAVYDDSYSSLMPESTTPCRNGMAKAQLPKPWLLRWCPI
jgi:putative spermidine/putrescine transport system permease protein